MSQLLAMSTGDMEHFVTNSLSLLKVEVRDFMIVEY